jgi:RimJ/RimL family protein N-acetyltransferase
MPSNRSIAERLPDLPRWVEARALLLWEPCEIFGFKEEPELSLVMREPDGQAVFVIGTPAVSAVQAAIQKNGRGEVIAPHEQANWLAEALPTWTQKRILVHTLRDPDLLPQDSGGLVNFLDPARLNQLPIDDELKREIEDRAEESLIAATFVDQQPVAFCYAGTITESLWDIAIDTLPEHRRKGYAALCVAHMIRYMLAQGKQPVWQSEEDNPASWRLAQKLGFVPVDELALFVPPEEAIHF